MVAGDRERERSQNSVWGEEHRYDCMIGHPDIDTGRDSSNVQGRETENEGE